jgi:predicted type IV restriction endonuclease
MPYIIQEDRKRYDDILNQLIAKLAEIPEEDRDGHINYCVTVMLKRLYAPPKYKRYNRAMGVLSCIAQEFYRRMIAPYENEKIKESGDVQ